MFCWQRLFETDEQVDIRYKILGDIILCLQDHNRATLIQPESLLEADFFNKIIAIEGEQGDEHDENHESLLFEDKLEILHEKLRSPGGLRSDSNIVCRILDSGISSTLFDKYVGNPATEILLGAIVLEAGGTFRPQDEACLRRILPKWPFSTYTGADVNTTDLIVSGFRSVAQAQFSCALDKHRAGYWRDMYAESCNTCGKTAADVPSRELIACEACEAFYEGGDLDKCKEVFWCKCIEECHYSNMLRDDELACPNRSPLHQTPRVFLCSEACREG